VLGTAQWSAPQTAHSLARAGYRVLGGWEGGLLSGRTRYCRKLFRLPPPAELDAFAAEIARVCETEHVVAIVPLADELLGALNTTRPADAGWVIVGGDERAFGLLCDKVALEHTAAAAGIPVPPSVVISPDGPAPGAAIPRLPAYVKMVTGTEAGRPPGRPVRVADTPTMEAVVGEYLARGESVLVQEEIVGEQWRFQFVRGTGAIAHIGARTVANYPYKVGPSTITIFSETPPGLEAVATALLDRAGYEGAGVAQFVLRDGEWFVHDVNLRMPSSVGGSIVAGLDMPALGVGVALGRPVDLRPVHVRPVKVVQAPGEIRAFRDALAGRDVGRPARRILGSMAHAVFSRDERLTPFDLTDPLPTIALVASLVRRSPADRERVEG
jgi:predicted ATP-grasp superfamily ATP-dependent carboligase